MKKIFALALATAMVASMASVAFAAKATCYPIDLVGSKAMKTNTDGDVILNKDQFPSIAYGKTFYYPLTSTTTDTEYKLVYEADAVRGLTAKPEWSMGKDLVSKVEVVKKKIDYKTNSDNGLVTVVPESAANYAYFIGVSLKDSTSTSQADVTGTIKLKKSEYKKNNNVYSQITDSVAINVGVSVCFPKAGVDLGVNPKTITKDIALFEKGKGFDENETEQFDITESGSNSYFTVDTFGQGKILASMSTKFDSDIAAKYPQGNLDFFKGNGATFNKIGELTLAAPAKSFLYVVKADGTLAPQKATYDEYEEAFKFKTRTLGQYVISDVELKLASSEVVVPETSTSVPTIEVTPSVPTVPVNPGTGAIA